MIKYFLFLFFVSIVQTTYAQTRFGIKGNFQFTNIREIHHYSERRDFGIALGAFVQIPLNEYQDKLFFKPEILYSQQGEYDGETKYFHDYINIPLLFKYYLSDFISLDRYGDIEIFAEGGPQIGFLIKEKNKEKDNLYYGKVSSTDISLGAGAGMSFWRVYEFNFRYNYGLTDTYKDYPNQNNTSNFAISLSYIF